MSCQGELFAGPSELPSGLVYQPDFLSPEEERDLLAGIAATTLQEAQYKQYTAKRRIASFGAGYDFDANELMPAPVMPPFLLPLRERIAAWTQVPAEAFGYALIAEYAAGTQLGWHRDVPQFEMVVGVSLAGTARMRLRRFPPRKGERPRVLDLAPRSAYVIKDEARWGWQHGIVATPALRYSITFRTRRTAAGTPAA